MASEQHEVKRVVEELEQRGAEDPTIQGDPSLAKYTTERDHPKATHTVEYVGEPETVRHACQALDRVHVLGVTTDAWPGGALAVSAELAITGHIGVLDGGSGGTNPRGNADDSASDTVPPPEHETERNPHVAPGGTLPVRDDAGFIDHYEVEVWPVRWWEPVPDVPAVLVLRYVPEADGLEWWTGYCRLSDRGEAPLERALRRLREKRIHAAGLGVTIDWHGGGWVGWSETKSTETALDGPAVHSGPVGWNMPMSDMGNQAAGDCTTVLARAVAEVRREVLPQ